MKAIIFDFGNVVGFFDHTRTLKALGEFTGLSPEEMYAAVYGSALEDELERGHWEEAKFLLHVQQLWQLRCEVDVLARAIGNVFWPNPEVCDLVPKLQGRYRLLLGSNTNIIHARHFREQFADTLACFDALVLSYEIGSRKPDASFFQHCVKLAKAEPGECVFIDDLASNIAGAKAAGLHAIEYRPEGRLEADLRAVGVDI